MTVDITEARETVLSLIDERISPENPWTGRRECRTQARKGHVGISLDQFDAAYGQLRAEGEIFTWHGLTTIAREEILDAISEAEREADVTRTLLIGNVYKIRNGLWPPDDPGQAESEQEVARAAE